MQTYAARLAWLNRPMINGSLFLSITETHGAVDGGPQWALTGMIRAERERSALDVRLSKPKFWRASPIASGRCDGEDHDGCAATFRPRVLIGVIHQTRRRIRCHFQLKLTGREAPAGDGSALDALIDFYRGFNASDLKALAANWAEDNAPSMDNPIGGIRRGWPAIKEGYAKLFSGPATVRVAFHDFTAQGNNDYHLFVGREKGFCETPAVRVELRIRTSRWFIKIRGAAQK